MSQKNYLMCLIFPGFIMNNEQENLYQTLFELLNKNDQVLTKRNKLQKQNRKLNYPFQMLYWQPKT